MKLKKKTTMLISFALGTLLLAGTALADISSKSGYDQLKDALKLTAANCSDKFNSFTTDITYVVKDNGKTIATDDSVMKYDRKKKAMESLSSHESYGRKSSGYSYFDSSTSISQNSQDDTYYVSQFSQPNTQTFFTNPFKNNGSEDVEKIVDAVVGSLKDYVVVKDNADGSKELSGTLSEVQIPPLVNAVASFEVKQQFRGRDGQSTPVIKDIYVKEIKGTALINKDGVMESILGTGILSGKDEQGQVHDLTFEVLAKVTGINSTTVVKPNLTGKKVIKQDAVVQKSQPGISDPQKFIGTFKNDIVVTKDGKFVKAGERIIDITQIDAKTVSGRYHEEYKPGFEQYASGNSDFKFEAKFNSGPNKDPMGGDIAVPGTNIQGNIHFDENMGKVYLGMNQPAGPNVDPIFNMELK